MDLDLIDTSNHINLPITVKEFETELKLAYYDQPICYLLKDKSKEVEQFYIAFLLGVNQEDKDIWSVCPICWDSVELLLSGEINLRVASEEGEIDRIFLAALEYNNDNFNKLITFNMWKIKDAKELEDCLPEKDIKPFSLSDFSDYLTEFRRTHPNDMPEIDFSKSKLISRR